MNIAQACMEQAARPDPNLSFNGTQRPSYVHTG